MLRLNVNIVLVAMINYTAIPHTEITPAEECGHLITNITTTQPSSSYVGQQLLPSECSNCQFLA